MYLGRILLTQYDSDNRGTLRIISEDSNTINRLLATAHLSTLANSKASDMAKLFPECVSLETFGRSQLWPECFQKLGPSSHHIALYFFPDSRCDDVLSRAFYYSCHQIFSAMIPLFRLLYFLAEMNCFLTDLSTKCTVVTLL